MERKAVELAEGLQVVSFSDGVWTLDITVMDGIPSKSGQISQKKNPLAPRGIVCFEEKTPTMEIKLTGDFIPTDRWKEMKITIDSLIEFWNIFLEGYNTGRYAI